MRKKLIFVIMMLMVIAGGGYMLYMTSVGALFHEEQPARVVESLPEVATVSFSDMVAQKYAESMELWQQVLLQMEAEAEAALEASLGAYETVPIEVTPRRPGEKVAYLTFDDGPGEYTEELLDILDAYEVKATFFVVGTMLDEQGAVILKDIAARGHTIGVHCYDHDYRVVYASVDAYLADFERVFEQIREITGIRPNVWRFPGGSTISSGKYVVPEVIKELRSRGFSFYDWNVSTGDGGNNTTSASVIANAKKTYPLYDEPVILMHDVKYSTVQAVPELIELLIRDGYAFDTVDHREPVGFVSVPEPEIIAEDAEPM